jgi:hypothetical protein
MQVPKLAGAELERAGRSLKIARAIQVIIQA